MREKYKMNLIKFEEMMQDKTWQINNLGINQEGSDKIKYKTGVKKTINYRSETVKGKEIPNFYADISFEDVFQEKTIPINIIYFEFLNAKDENEFLDWLKK